MHWTEASDWTPEQRTLFFQNWSDADLFKWLANSKTKLRHIRTTSRRRHYISFNHKVRAEIGARIAVKLNTEGND